ncbi:MAG: O-succinylhomoserine sulfhydrylase [Inquilinus sp.]|nr:O-succinylhomoserine sulfhydrylase [Inquilinus sp.]
MSANDDSLRPQTRLVRGGQLRSGFDETSEALYLTSGFVYETAELAERAFKNEIDRFVYSRFSNPTVAMFEERLRQLEGAEACRATATGMAAVHAALMCQLKAGDRVVASRALFGSCQYIVADLLPRFGVETAFVDGDDLDGWRAALTPGARAVFLETPANPTLALIDIAAVSELAHAAGACVIVDNVFATPLLQKPLELGADVVVYSATKHIDGQGRCLGGAVLGRKAFVEDTLGPFLRHTGPSLSPFNAWVLLKGLETLALRVDRHCANAARLAEFLEAKPGVARVHYPHLASHPQAELARRQMSAGGSLVALELAGGKPAAFAFLNALRLFDISNNLGDAKSLATHPATTTHQRLSAEARAAMGITDGMVRLSVGLEDVEDLLADLERALAA